MQTKSIVIKILFKNQGITKSCLLNGYAFIESGFLSGKIESLHDQWDKQEQVLLTAFTFTGCPIAARVENSKLNPWLMTKGSYKSTRTLKGNGFEIAARLSSIGGEDEITMNLNLECNGKLPSFNSIKYPFQESIYQIQRGILEGKFDVVFGTNDGQEFNAQATSKYELDIDEDTVPVWRNITILNAGEIDNFVQVEQIDLFGDKNVADRDLSEKSRVVVSKN